MKHKPLKTPPGGSLNGEFLPKADEYRKAVDSHNGMDSRGYQLGRTSAQPLREKRMVPAEKITATTKEGIAAEIKRIASNPTLLASVLADSRRPAGVARDRYGVAIRAAVGDRMLTANPGMVEKALQYNPAPKLASAGLYERLVVKPLNARAAKLGRSTTFWGERMWSVHRPKYGRGFFIRDDMNNDSRVFPSMGELHSAVKKTGFDIIRR